MSEIESLVRELDKRSKTISAMESCTGGALANEITNIKGASNVLKYSAVTYSDEYKIKMGVEKSIIYNYGIYSKQTAKEMAKSICTFAKSDFGIGITGIINKEVYICIYDREHIKYYDLYIILENVSRKENKEKIVMYTINKMKEILDF